MNMHDEQRLVEAVENLDKRMRRVEELIAAVRAVACTDSVKTPWVNYLEYLKKQD